MLYEVITLPKYFYQNKRYIFFTLTPDGPQGSGGGEVVAERSIATDKAIYPAGGLAFIRIKVVITSYSIHYTKLYETKPWRS